ncbi:MAG: DUF1311 domain-containing protein [Planctomycetales bacterium]|nr:DUF1311 domain-containing protein [Planctomycetales bacterium]
MKDFARVLAVCVAALSCPVHAGETTCNPDSSKSSEFLPCAALEFERAQAALVAELGRLNDLLSPRQLEELSSDQVKWIEERDLRCKTQADEGLADGSEAYWGWVYDHCRAESTWLRVDTLREWK